MLTHDLIILGGGPAGYTAAERAARGGLNTLLIEKRALGGVCLNEGCIPTKTLLYSAKIWHLTEDAKKYGIEASADQFLMDKVNARKNKVVRKLVAGIKGKMTNAGVTVVTGEGEILAPTTPQEYSVKVGEETYTAPRLLLASGSETFVPPIPGLDTVDYWTSREALESKELPKSIAIIGGGVIGMEFAAFYNRVGVEVHVIEMLPEILGGMDSEMGALLRAEYTKLGVKFYLQHKVTSVAPDGVTVEFEDNSFVIPTERILLSVGRRPVTEKLSPLGLEMEGRGVKVDATMRTSLPGVYAAGDVTGYSLLAHTAVREAEVAVDNMLGKNAQMSYRAIPGIIYTQPEVAGVGMTEDQLKKEGINYRKHQLPMAFAGRFVAENEMANGVCKILIGEDDTLLGAHMLGNPASELIVVIAVAIERGIKAHELASVVFPHPTVGEIIKETIESSPVA
ncbi:dihydrolipoyl dehydrogenase [Porphyromonas endodontalis]|uniref:Dihydrolipoyl dehydrogenase n=1 Tax=Porphyromonas endodontalis (strain ATCC 35406 / DSM 24491 / JCM 8526 / CCUG 16442 / BCRC 14492 / NCTC 13058 / HG 370) TaxID=553175 RepID=C3JBB1_POREA|nr:dihydrolipoyl dehydrogenase [Porphyromonas endodontalis]EEN82528.1 dihydrolipoyl dehydrogenase [Porphyromonas endodontalis ATCC 35406]UBH63920.1 dihydrolipoyl dehydrogenase [Porphyromonas endodontalis]SUB67830.1 Dihydrolipoyl dehydrogenase [Porphyromonas endodontalis]